MAVLGTENIGCKSVSTISGSIVVGSVVVVPGAVLTKTVVDPDQQTSIAQVNIGVIGVESD